VIRITKQLGYRHYDAIM